jgi:Leucine-rich repeat (LRR) protein
MLSCFVAGCGSKAEPTAPVPAGTNAPATPTPGGPPVSKKTPDARESDNPFKPTPAELAKIEAARKLGADIMDPKIDESYWLTVKKDKDADAILKALKGVRAFGVVNLSESNVTDDGLRALEGYSNLRALRLNGCEKVTGVGLEPFAKTPREGSFKLECQSSGVTDAGCKVIATIPKLWSLNLASTKMTDDGLAALSKLDGLKLFDVNFTSINGTGFQAKGWATLESISAMSTELTDGALEPIGAMPILTSFQADRTGITDVGVKHLARSKSIADLYLRDTKITDTGLAELGKMPALRELSLSFVPIAGAGFAAFPENSPLTELEIPSTKLNGAGAKNLARFKELTNLAIKDCPLADKDLGFLKELKKLKELSLNNVEAGDGTMMLLGTLPELEKVSLEKTKITDTGLKALVKAPKLQNVNCRGTLVTKATVDMLMMQKGAPTISSDAK